MFVPLPGRDRDGRGHILWSGPSIPYSFASSLPKGLALRITHGAPHKQARALFKPISCAITLVRSRTSTRTECMQCAATPITINVDYYSDMSELPPIPQKTGSACCLISEKTKLRPRNGSSLSHLNDLERFKNHGNLNQQSLSGWVKCIVRFQSNSLKTSRS